MRQHLGLIGAILPLVLVAIALIGFVLTLRNDLNATQVRLDAIQQELDDIQGNLEDERAVRVQSHMNQQKDIVNVASDIMERINRLEKSLAVANDQMQTIMGDHSGFADVLRELGEAGALPSGERRAYGGYGN